MAEILGQSEKTVLMTGVTGFIGSYLAAAFLRRGHRVIALTRNDPDGTRTKSAIEVALHQDREAVSVIDFVHQLLVLPYDIAYARAHHHVLLASVDEVWHCAAEMSFSPKKLESSFQFNVGMTNDLYRTISEESPNCKRFFYVSTAYTGGAEAGIKREVLHLQPQLINPYQVTKWSTEMSLATHVTQGAALPVTIFRPSVVIGDTRTGYYPGSPFGIYMYFMALKAAKSLGASRLTVDLNLESVLQMVPIEVLVANAMALSDREYGETCEYREPLEIYHITGQAISNSLTMQSGKRIVGLDVSVGLPETTFDFFADKICSWVKRFGNGQIQFDDEKLKKVLGEAYVPTILGEAEFDTLFSWYSKHLEDKEALRPKAEWQKPLAFKVIDRFTTKGQKQRIASYMLRRK